MLCMPHVATVTFCSSRFLRSYRVWTVPAAYSREIFSHMIILCVRAHLTGDAIDRLWRRKSALNEKWACKPFYGLVGARHKNFIYHGAACASSSPHNNAYGGLVKLVSYQDGENTHAALRKMAMSARCESSNKSCQQRKMCPRQYNGEIVHSAWHGTRYGWQECGSALPKINWSIYLQPRPHYTDWRRPIAIARRLKEGRARPSKTFTGRNTKHDSKVERFAWSR